MTERAHGGNKKSHYDFSVNLNPFISEKYIKKIISSISQYAISYPEERSESLLEVLANFYKLKNEQIVAGNGSIELLYYIPRVMKVKRIVTLEPTFCEYRYLSEIYGIIHLPIYNKDYFSWDFEELKNTVKNGDLVIVCNPNNPTGNIFPKETLLDLLSRGVYMLVDEAFMDFSERDESLINYLNNYEKLLVLKSFTKIFSIAGLRIGFMLGNKSIIDNLKRILPLWNVNAIAIEATKMILKDREIIEKTKELIKRERKFLLNGLKELPLNVFNSNANFFLIKMERAKDFVSFAEKEGISVRTSAGFLGLDDTYIRVAVKKRPENRILLNTFRKFFKV
ncbi:MAG: histidinol-phosphate aminotransferase family protein [Proteobacteria bacterium]|nr:histidinol-phosphate aminotransferase family protein [Pseudomonadota bacterium]